MGLGKLSLVDSDLGDVTVVILSHNRRQELERTFLPLCRESVSNNLQLVIVDNASTDGSVDLIQEATQGFPQVVAVMNNENVGAAEGRNRGWLRADREFILSLDDDTRVEINQVAELVRHLRGIPRAAILFPEMVDSSTGRLLGAYSESRCSPGNFLEGCFLLRASALRDIGLLGTSFVFGGEGVDYSIRLRSRGWDIVFEPSIRVLHNGLQRQGRFDRARRLHWTRGFARIHFTYFPPRQASILSTRLLSRQLFSGVPLHGASLAPQLARAVFAGAADAWPHRTSLPDHVRRFYLNPRTRPDIGNVPLARSLVRRISRRLLSRPLVARVAPPATN